MWKVLVYLLALPLGVLIFFGLGIVINPEKFQEYSNLGKWFIGLIALFAFIIMFLMDGDIDKISPTVKGFFNDVTQDIKKDAKKSEDKQSNTKAVLYDSNLSLYWDRCTLGQRWENNTCKGEAGRYTWRQANDKVKELNRQNYMGHNDWRLPHIEELHTLIYCSSKKYLKKNDIPTKSGKSKTVGEGCSPQDQKPTIIKQSFPNTKSGRYWTSTSVTDNNKKAWVVRFQDGLDSYDAKSEYYYIRVVRSGK